MKGKLILEFDLEDREIVDRILRYLDEKKGVKKYTPTSLELQIEEFYKHRRISARIYYTLRRNKRTQKVKDLKELCLLIATGDIAEWNNIGSKALDELRKAFQSEIEEFGYARHTKQK